MTLPPQVTSDAQKYTKKEKDPISTDKSIIMALAIPLSLRLRLLIIEID